MRRRCVSESDSLGDPEDSEEEEEELTERGFGGFLPPVDIWLAFEWF